MLLRCRDLWFYFYVTCCYAAEISGFVATLHVATLHVATLQRPLFFCHTVTIDAAWTSCKQFIPNSLGARHKDVMLYAKMWQWRFINKYKKLLEKTAQMLRKIDACICPIKIDKKITVYCSENTICPKTTEMDVQISNFSSDNNGCLAVAKHTFFCKTLFSRARFPVRRVYMLNVRCMMLYVCCMCVTYAEIAGAWDRTK